MIRAASPTQALRCALRPLQTLFATLWLLAVAPVSLRAEKTRWFDVPGGDALSTLRTFAAQAGGRLLYSIDVVEGIKTQPVHGEMSASDALRRMLVGSGLEPARDRQSGALVIRRRPTPKVPNAAAPSTAVEADLTAAPDEMIRLPTFTLRSERDPRYVGTQAMSTTRIGADLMDLPQAVRVLNKAFLADVNPTILAKALTYVGGAQTGTINWSVDRYMIRGFVGEGDFVDGFRTATDRNTDMNLIDHVEIIKGPAAIFVANQSATVGGVVNKVSKSPTDYHVGTLTVEVGRWDANRADLDIGGPVTPHSNLLWRFLAAAQDTRGYYDRTYEKRTSLLPMLAYRFSDDAEVWLKYETFNSHYSSYNGIPLDGRTGRIADVPPTTNSSEDNPLNWRTDWFARVWGQFTAHPSDMLAIRLAAFDSHDTQRRVESIPSVVGATTPTLQSNGSFAFTPYAQYVIPPNYQPGRLIARTVTAINSDNQPRREVQNDYVFTFTTGAVSHKLLLGGDLISYPEATWTYSGGPYSTAFTSPVDPFASWRAGTISVDFQQRAANETDRSQFFAKGYVLETAGFLHDHLIVSLGMSRNRFALSTTSTNFDQATRTVAGVASVPETVLYNNCLQYGVVVKPVANVSLFYGYNENFSANPIQFGQFLPPLEGRQHEAGLKSTWLDGAIEISVNHFEVTQHNNSVPAYPQTTPPSQILVPGTVSRGWDGDFTLNLGRNLDMVGSFAWMRARVPLPTPWNLAPQPYDGRVYSALPVNNASERNVAVWTHYKFTTPSGLAVGIGVSSLARRAITDNANLVFYGYAPGRTLVDAAVTYQTRRFKFQLNADNLLNHRYIYAVRSEQVIVPGSPLNLRASVTTKF